MQDGVNLATAKCPGQHWDGVPNGRHASPSPTKTEGNSDCVVTAGTWTWKVPSRTAIRAGTPAAAEPQGGRENIRSEATVVSGPSQWLAHHPVVSICLEEKLASIYNYSDLCSQFG